MLIWTSPGRQIDVSVVDQYATTLSFTILSGFGRFGIIVDGRTDRQTILQRREDTVFHWKLSVLAIKECRSIFACAPKKVSAKTKEMIMHDKNAVELDNLKLARK